LPDQKSRRGSDNLIKDLYLSFDIKVNLGDDKEPSTGGGKNFPDFDAKKEYDLFLSKVKVEDGQK